MKKILAVLMSMIVITGVCGVGTGCDPNKETEAEYKARIKKELDEIPVEATGYKLIAHDDSEKWKYEFLNCSEGGVICYKEINNHSYDVTVLMDKSFSDEDYGFHISIDGGEQKWISFNYDKNFMEFGRVYQLAFYDDKIFIVRAKKMRGWISEITDNFPPTLFIYDYLSNTIKYMGYYIEWFNYSIYDGRGQSAEISKIELQEEK